MNNIDIIWFVEHIARELDVACIVSNYLKKRFHKSVVLIPYHTNDYRKISAKYSPKLVVIPYCYSEKDSGLRNFLPLWKNSFYFNMSWEELYYKAYVEYKAPRGDFVCNKVFHHAWSLDFKNYLINHKVDQKNIFVNGQPSYRLYSSPYNRLFFDRKKLAEKYFLDINRKWVLFTENYGWAFFSKYQQRKIIENGKKEEEVRLLHKFCKDSLFLVLNWLNRLAKEEDYEIIIRPRPAVSEETFIKEAKNIIGEFTSNFHIIKNETARDWILASDIILSSFSTTLIEAAIAGKPAFMLEPVKIPDPLQAKWYKNIDHLKTYDDLKSSLRKNGGKVKSKRLVQWAKKELMGNSDPLLNLAYEINRLLSKIEMTDKGNENISDTDRQIELKEIFGKLRGQFIRKFSIEKENNIDIFNREVSIREEKLEKLGIE